MRAPLVVGVVWVAGGIAAGLQRPIPPGGGPLLIAVALTGAMAALALGSVRRGEHGARGVLVLLGLAGGVLGLCARTGAERSCLHWIPGDQALGVRGTIVQIGRGNGAGARPLRLRIDSVHIRGGEPVTAPWRPCGASLPGRWEGSTVLGVGDPVRGHGRWWSPPGSRSGVHRPGTLLLDSLRLETATAVHAARSDPPLRAFSPSHLARLGIGTRDAGARRIEAVFTRHAALVASLLLARRDGLDPEVRDRFARAGLSHLLAISGLHVGLIAGILLLLAGALRVGRSRAAAVAAAGTVLYVAMLGAPDSAARAALQIILVLAARALQRPGRTEAMIAAAALVLLAADPAALTRPGFQLSFAGVAGIVALRRPLLDPLRVLSRLRLWGRPAGRWLADGLATSLAATVATAPIVAWHFGRLAPIGIAANLIAIPLLGLIVPALALALAAGSVWLPAGRFVAGGGELLLDLLDRLAAAAAAVPFGTVAVLPSSALAVTVAVALGFGLSRRLGRVRTPVRGAVWIGAACAFLLVAPLRPGGDRVEIHMIDVGQGDAIGIRSPGGRWLLVDAGLARADYDAGASRVVPYLAGRGVRRLEALLITHPDGDHMGGAGAVMRSFRPRWAGGPAVVAGKAQYVGLLRDARDRGVPWIAIRRGVQLEVDGMTMRVLYPGDADVEVEDANDASLVLRVAYGEFAALLTGDAPARVEAILVRQLGARLEADVLKVGHHGSSTSTSTALLRATGARTAIISAGRGNRYGHPDAGVLARLRQGGVSVYRTDHHGSVVVRARADGVVRVRTEREGGDR